ncbi:MAG: GNAT family N-acetyltransferase [Chloroflexota bacterium]|nr:GNAT family N-acetyltransferase [Chloroflexota bacterium]
MDILRLVAVDPRSDPRWAPFVAAHPDGTVYHHPAWLRLLERVYGYTPMHLACETDEGHLRGVLPLFRTRGLITGRGLASLPRTPVAGPLAHDRRALAALVSAAIERVRAEPGGKLQFRILSTELDGLAEGLVGTPWETTYVLDLPQNSATLRFGNSRNHGRIKWAVNKAERLGVRVRPAETERELRAWYELYLDAMRWHVVPPRPYRFFQACWRELRPSGLMRLLLAEQVEAGRSRLLAGSLLLMFGHTVFYAFNGRRRDDLSLQPNNALQWRAIHDACREGYRRYDLGAVMEGNVGLADFKAKWGAEPRHVHKFYYPGLWESEPGTVPVGGKVRRAADAAWRRLPLRATALIGNIVYSRL